MGEGPTIPSVVTESPTAPVVVNASVLADGPTPILNNRDKYKATLDTDANGTVSDQEIMSYELNRRKTNGPVLDLSEDQAAQAVFTAINSLDQNNDGIISSIETLDAILASKANSNTNTSDPNVAMVLGTNDKFAQLQTALASVSSATTASDNEVVNILLALRAAGLGHAADWTSANHLKNNAQVGKISNAVNIADSDANGIINDDEAVLLHLRSKQGTIDLPQTTINSIAGKNANSSAIQNAWSRTDTNNDGIISDDEATAMLARLRNNEFDATTSTFINKILATNIHTAELSHMLNSLDINKDGSINTQEFALGYLNVNKTNVDSVGPLGAGALAYLKAKNPDIATVQSMLDTLDTSSSGSKDGIITRSDLASKLGTLLITNGNIDNDKKRILTSFIERIVPEANTLINQIDRAPDLTDSLRKLGASPDGVVSDKKTGELISMDLNGSQSFRSIDEALLSFMNPNYASIKKTITDYTAGKGTLNDDLLIVNVVAKFRQGRINQDQYTMLTSLNSSLPPEKLDAIRKALDFMDPFNHRNISDRVFNDKHQDWIKHAENLGSKNVKKRAEAQGYMKAHPEYNFYKDVDDAQYPSPNDMSIFNIVSDYLRDDFARTQGFGKAIKDL